MTIVIAEVGLNHNGDFELAKKMIKTAKDCGADMVKLQTYTAKKIKVKEDFEAFNRAQLTEEEFNNLKDYSKDIGIDFITSVFDLESAALAKRSGMKKIKIASSELDNKNLLEFINKNFDEVILSTGMATLGEIETAIDRLKDVNLSLLHCHALYPSELKDLNLYAMDTMKQAFQLPTGFSDHSLGIIATLVAAVMGANIIEKHFTLDKNMEGTDHICSADPEELKKICEFVKQVPIVKGSPIKAPSEAETKVIKRMRGRWK